MRIGIFSEAYTPYISGLVTSIVMLKKALEDMGHEVYVVTANLEEYHYDYDEKNRILRIPGIPTGIYNSRLTAIYPIQAINKIRSWRLDVIHSQTEFAIGTFARIFGKQYGIPVVHTYHTMYEDYIHYVTKGHFKKSSKKLVEYLTLFYCDKTITELIVPTKKAYDLFKEKYNVKRNIYIIPTGIDVERFYKENINLSFVNKLKKQYDISKKDFIILFVGRLGSEKNVELLLNLVLMMYKDYSNIKLLIVGDGPEKEEYENISRANKTDKNIIFTGKVPWEEIPVYYQLADVFITASKTETQGLTVVEGLAAGLPVLCINDESFVNTVIDGFNGFMFDSIDECVDRLITLINDKNLYNSLSKNAVSSAQMHSSKYFAQMVESVYLKAINVQKSKLSNKAMDFLRRVISWRR